MKIYLTKEQYDKAADVAAYITIFHAAYFYTLFDLSYFWAYDMIVFAAIGYLIGRFARLNLRIWFTILVIMRLL